MDKKNIDEGIRTLESGGFLGFFGASIDDRRNAAFSLRYGDSSAVPALIRALKDKDIIIQNNAAEALGKIGDTRAIPHLIESIRVRGRENNTADQALLMMKDPQGVPALLEAIEDKNSYIRRLAVGAIANIDDPRVAPALIKAFKDNDQEVRKVAISEIKKIRDHSVLPSLIELLKDGDSDIRLGATRPLISMGMGSIVVPTLIELLNDRYKSRDYKIEIAKSLGTIGDPTAIPALIKALEDWEYNDIIVRSQAALSLGTIGGPTAIPVLIKALENHSEGEDAENVRISAAGALGGIGDPCVIPVLIKAFENHSGHYGWKLREYVAYVLGQIGDPSAIPVLIKALGVSGSSLRKAILRGLETMNDMRTLKSIEYVMKNDSNKEVREAAFKAAAKIRSSHGILEEEPTHKISAGGDILVDSAKFSANFSDNSTKISDVGMIKGNIGGKKEVPFSKCPYCGAELNLPKTPKFCPYCGDQLRE